MSPEQEEACAAAHQGRPLPLVVDGRSDLYSLGRLLYIALGGNEGTSGRSLPPLHRCNPQVSVGLSDLVHRCLSLRPEDRYPNAAALAADLRRHLAHLPLRGVANRSLREQWHKWRRRRPNAALWVGLLSALTAAGILLFAGALDRFHDARSALAEARSQMQRGVYRDAVGTLQRGRGQIQGLPRSASLLAEIDAELRQARRAEAAQDLHAVAESLRFLAGADVHAPRELQALEAHCRVAWEARGMVANSNGTALDAAREEQIRADFLDLALIWIDLKRQIARTASDNDWREEVRTILAEARELVGPSAALVHEWRILTGMVETESAESSIASRRASWEHLALGQSLLRSGQLERAAEELERAVDLRPQDFWANFFRGVCAYRRGQYPDAAHAFSIALALAPESAEVHHNRALAYVACGKNNQALRDYDRALELAPNLGAALLNRGVLHYQEGRRAQARTDLERALLHGADPAAAHYNLALVHLALREEVAAQRHLEQALKHDPAHAGARSLQTRLRPSK
jgi:Flp pilus assembly protein TadD